MHACDRDGSPRRDGPPPDFATRQSAFAASLLDAGHPVPPGLVGPDGQPGIRRFAVYRNNVIAGLADALKATFPATCRIVGDTFFAAMARAYVARHPPRSPVMLHYGDDFADFIGAFRPAASLPYLPDVARLEHAWAAAYHAAEATPLAAAAFAGIAPARLPTVSLALHPSVRIVRSRFPIVGIWQMNVEGGVPAAIDLDAGGEDAFIMRPAADVEVRVLPPGAAAFVVALAAGARLVDAVDAAQADAPGFDPAGALTALFDAGAVIGNASAGAPAVPHFVRLP